MVLESSIYYVGLITIASLATKAAQFAYLYLRRSSLLRYKHGPTSWALITGASDGIGYAFAEELCQQGFNVVLLGHKPEELEGAQASIKAQFPQAEVRILVVDAISSSTSLLENKLATIKDLNITILINNVGGPVMASHFKPLDQYSLQQIDDTMYLNARFMARITRLLLPDLSRNGPSLIMNISSGSHKGLPYQVIYSASKGFVSSFSAALSSETAGENLPIEVIAIVPGGVHSKINPKPLSWDTPSARTYAKATLGMVGCGEPFVSGYWRHALQIMVFQSFPSWLRQKIIVSEMKKMALLEKKD